MCSIAEVRPPDVMLIEDPKDLDKAVRTLVRIGYDQLEGFVGDSFEAWSTAARTHRGHGRARTEATTRLGRAAADD